jgi:hypothetical protein
MRTSVTTGIFTGSLSITNPINLPKVGMYTFSFYTFIYCPKNNTDTDDFISVKIKESGSNFRREIFRKETANKTVQNIKWVKETVSFNAQTTQIYVSYGFL